MISRFALPVLAALIAMSGTASAQEALQSGRYQIYPGAIESGEQTVPVLLDTQFGRTWILVPHEKGFAWRRIPINKVGTTGDGPAVASPVPRPVAHRRKPNRVPTEHANGPRIPFRGPFVFAALARQAFQAISRMVRKRWSLHLLHSRASAR